ncbi:dioxygenase [Nocardia sp. NPDC050710]|uniref:dioxygenase family protein n=1 Tax=Nocardia sp. NPDC050710 TaxID=3157220 RepID=UPI0033E21E10
MVSRRRALVFLGAVGTATVAAGCSSISNSTPTSTTADAAASTTTSAPGAVEATPQETTGPYPGDGSNGPNILIASGVVRSDITTSFGSFSGAAQGVPMKLELILRDLARDGAAGAGMAVYVWHCDREGRYSLYDLGAIDQNYLRGVQVADESGTVTFTSIFPACYSGRWPHIHFEVYDSLTSAVAGSNARLTSQIALPQDVCESVYAYDTGYAASPRNLSGVSLSSDNVFGDGWDAELATVSGAPASGLTVSLTIGVAAKSQNTAKSQNPQPGNGSGRPPGPGGPPPGGR